MKGTKFIGACCQIGQRKIGVDSAPMYISKYMPKLNIELITDFKESSYLELYRTHNKYIKDNKVITIGGDHSISGATVASSLDTFGGELNVVWVDAHADIHTFASSETKNTHGMPLGSLMGHDKHYNIPLLNESQLTYIGLRDVDPYEQGVISDSDITVYDMDYIKNKSICNVIEHLNKITGPIHLSFDVDSIDPAEFSSTGTPVENGLTMTDVWTILDTIKDKTVSCDFVEFNPYLSNHLDAKRDTVTLSNMISHMSK